jgi:tRNA pseudouridine55 synthase
MLACARKFLHDFLLFACKTATKLQGDILRVPAWCRRSRSTVCAPTVGCVLVSRSRLSERPVTVRKFLLGRQELEVDWVGCADLSVIVECSLGTYIRALARDPGAALAVGGHLSSLRRTRVGPFTLDEAQTLEEAGRGLRVVAPGSGYVQQFPNFNGQRNSGWPDPERSAVGWRDLARRHHGIT